MPLSRDWGDIKAGTVPSSRNGRHQCHTCQRISTRLYFTTVSGRLRRYGYDGPISTATGQASSSLCPKYIIPFGRAHPANLRELVKCIQPLRRPVVSTLNVTRRFYGPPFATLFSFSSWMDSGTDEQEPWHVLLTPSEPADSETSTVRDSLDHTYLLTDPLRKVTVNHSSFLLDMRTAHDISSSANLLLYQT